MTNSPNFHGDPDGLFAEAKLVEEDFVEKRLVIEGLTDEQILSIGNAIAVALQPYRSRATRLVAKGIGIALGSVVITGLAWVATYIITHFPTTSR